MKLILLLFVTNLFAQQYTAKVVGIKDGDTIEVLDSLNTQITLRLAEVDCPEKNQPFGTKSKQFTSDQVYKKTINYIVTDTDRYGRLIAKVYYDNKYLSEEIIKNGMGWHYKKYSKSKKLAELEIIARKNKIGLWVDNNPIEPHNWRKL
jgi:micrococcal nuclease